MHNERALPAAPSRASWQRIVALLAFALALLVLGYGFGVRPWLSRTVGEQIAAEIGDQMTTHLEAQLAAALTGRAAPPPAAEATGSAPAEVAGVAQQPAGSAPQALAPGAPNAPPAPIAASQAELVAQAAQAATALAVGIGQAPAGPTQPDAQAPAGSAVAAPNAAQPAAQPSAPAGGAVVAPVATPTTPPAPTPEPLATALPRVIEALPEGEIVLSEDAVNRRIGQRLPPDGPIEEAEMRFVPDEMRVTLVILGTVNEIRSGLAVVGGRVVVRNPVLTGPMALVISVNDLIDPIEEQVNASLGVTDRELIGVRIDTGQIVVTIQ